MVDTSSPDMKAQSYSFATVCRVKLLMWQLQVLDLPSIVETLLQSLNPHPIEWKLHVAMPIAMDAAVVIFSM
jgi:hypothetical protein